MSTKRRESAKSIKAQDGTILCSCGCGRVPVKPRRSWFSEECVEAWKIKNDPGHVRFLLRRRDKGICAACGCDSEKEYGRYWDAWKNAQQLLCWLESRERCRVGFLIGHHNLSDEVMEALWGTRSRKRVQQLRKDEEHRLMGQQNPGWTLGRSTAWDADHILEVVLGGGQCGLENYQTLCHPCHKAKTARLARERAQSRKLSPCAVGTDG